MDFCFLSFEYFKDWD